MIGAETRGWSWNRWSQPSPQETSLKCPSDGGVERLRGLSPRPCDQWGSNLYVSRSSPCSPQHRHRAGWSGNKSRGFSHGDWSQKRPPISHGRSSSALNLILNFSFSHLVGYPKIILSALIVILRSFWFREQISLLTRGKRMPAEPQTP